ncbi:MAG: site-specific integrase [Pseudomonadota bacterium]|nr:site-specific integrase [Gammaproteobacteria bacterium]MBU1628659.1 site-specific integrase [Gammaproteobacteria bacterium]MBU1926936.1 site-specific integrase [Gammaproteobacteria bacterium]MBU2545877.1 site-specific integrase [Gammaproteobacteria bacterium]
MNTKKTLLVPKPLFDTLDFLTEGHMPCVIQYVTALPNSSFLNELDACRGFLLNYGGSLDTFNTYRREVERVLHWTWLVQNKTLKELKRDDIRAYIDFSNTPPVAWIATKKVSRFVENQQGERVQNKDWRPYVACISKAQRHEGYLPNKNQYQMSQAGIQAIFSVLSTFFTYLQQEEYLDINPVSLIRQKKQYIRREQTRKVTRKLSHIQWLYVIETAERMASENVENERILFLMTAFFLLGLRISELAETKGRIPHMGDFAPDKNGLWWFTTVGKGNKIRDVAVPDSMLEALKRYRKARDMLSLPAREESTPLLAKQRGHGGLGTRHIRNLVQQCFDRAIYRLQQENKLDEAQDLAHATVHWLRHTAISHDVEDRPREHVRDDVGHESSTTTDRYIDIDRIARHESAQKKKLKPD